MLLYPGNLREHGQTQNCWPTSYPRKFGVLHAFGANATAQQTYDAFMNPNAGASTTFIVSKAGEVFQLMDVFFSHWGNCCPTNPTVNWFPAGNANNWTWAIEFEKHTSDNSEPLTDAQKAEGFKLIAWLCHVCGTPPHSADASGGIMTHSFLDPVHRPGNHDPGPFPLDELWAYLKGATTLVELPNFPILSQRTTITSDQQYSENAATDCVYAAIGMCIQYWRRKMNWDTDVNPDAMKDEAQGQGYVGGGNAALSVPFCAKFGLDLVQIKGSNTQLVAAMHANLKAGYPSILTIVSIYDPAWWHVHACFKETSGGLGAVDPYPNPPSVAENVKVKSDADWISKLQGGSIWVVKPKGAIMGLPTGATDDGASIHFANSPYVLIKGYRDLYKQLAATNQIPSDDMPISNEYGANPVEQSNPAFWGGPGTAQETRYFRFGWSPKVPPRRLYMGQELRWYMQSLSAVQNENAQLKAKVAALQAIIDAGGQGIPQVVKDDITAMASHLSPAVTVFTQLIHDAGLDKPLPTEEPL